MERDPDALAFTFLGDGEQESGRWTYSRLDQESKALAALLQEHNLAGERVLLLLPSSLELVRALFGCVYAGSTFVVSALPPPRKEAAFQRLLSIAVDCRPRGVITTAKLKEAFQSGLAGAPGLEGLRWLTDEDVGAAGEWNPPDLAGDSLAFLQYTSGSTAAPRGVMVSHENLLANVGQIAEGMALKQGDVDVCWLPLHHDMGLVGMLFGNVFASMSCVLMSPLHFIQRPIRWLKAISRYRGHVSGGPNFAYDLCLRKIAIDQCEGIDLSSWRVAFNGAEPVRAATLERFAEKFAVLGLRPQALYPCYGLAEATLFVVGKTSDRAVVRTYDAAALKEDRVAPAPAGEGARALVSCGRPRGQEAVIADLETARRCPPGRIGEIWVAGPNVCQGYWELPQESARTFGARLAGEPEAGPFLRTGDLGFFDGGDLFVTGRYKDLIIIAGSNHYPQDIEQTVEDGTPSVRSGCCVAISVDVDGEEERLVVLAEVPRGEVLDESARSIRRLVAAEHDLRVHDVVLVRPGGIPKTTSGKNQRHACKAAYRNGELARWESPVEV
ncbi:MAG TPA: fatty acyl-AMP ligase [Thermoanaerobaculia bacterium]|nr:fatty acyl-AMP ligase [Thermoanaerobaculia bacterium]